MPALFKSATFFPLQNIMQNIVPYVSSKGSFCLGLHLRHKNGRVGGVWFAFRVVCLMPPLRLQSRLVHSLIEHDWGQEKRTRWNCLLFCIDRKSWNKRKVSFWSVINHKLEESCFVLFFLVKSVHPCIQSTGDFRCLITLTKNSKTPVVGKSRAS